MLGGLAALGVALLGHGTSTGEPTIPDPSAPGGPLPAPAQPPAKVYVEGVNPRQQASERQKALDALPTYKKPSSDVIDLGPAAQLPSAGDSGPSTGSAAVRKGNQGPDVVNVQALLIAVGYPLVVSGDFDAATDLAVRDYQRKHGLAADGIVGPKTWASLAATYNEQTKASLQVTKNG